MILYACLLLPSRPISYRVHVFIKFKLHQRNKFAFSYFPTFSFSPALGTSGEINTTLRKQTNGKALRTHLCFAMRISSSKCLRLLCAITAPAIPVNGRRFISNFKIPSRKLVKTSRKWIYFTANRVVSQTKLLSHSQSSPASSKSGSNETGTLCNKQQSWTPQW